jgi:RNA polymerase sigma-70 factor (ECF subfamily)
MSAALFADPATWSCFVLGDRAWAPRRPSRVTVDPDRALIERATRGDRHAFTELYRRHVDAVHRRLAHLVGPDPEREDLLQQVFLDVFRAISSFRGDSAFSTWLYRIIVNVAYEHLRRRGRRACGPLSAAELELQVAPGLCPEAAARQRQQVTLALTLLGRLKPKKRIAFVLRVVEGLSLEEIAEIVGARAPAVGQRVKQAQRELVAMYEREERKRGTAVAPEPACAAAQATAQPAGTLCRYPAKETP